MNDTEKDLLLSDVTKMVERLKDARFPPQHVMASFPRLKTVQLIESGNPIEIHNVQSIESAVIDSRFRLYLKVGRNNYTYFPDNGMYTIIDHEMEIPVEREPIPFRDSQGNTGNEANGQ